MEDFQSEGNTYSLGLYGNYKPSPFFRIGLFRVAMLSTTSSPVSVSITNFKGTSNFTANPYVETSMITAEHVVSTNTVTDKGIIVQSSDPFSLVAFDEEFTSADAYKALPCIHLPVQHYYEYYVVSVPRARIPVEDDDDYDYSSSDSNFEPILGNSVFIIVTCEADTDLNITLTQNVTVQDPLSTYRGGSSYSIHLEKESSTFLFSSENDLSGSRITSSRPITLISGHECGAIPSDKNFCDHMAEQVPPTVTWGTHFLTAPIKGGSSFDLFKVIAARKTVLG